MILETTQYNLLPGDLTSGNIPMKNVQTNLGLRMTDVLLLYQENFYQRKFCWKTKLLIQALETLESREMSHASPFSEASAQETTLLAQHWHFALSAHVNQTIICSMGAVFKGLKSWKQLLDTELVLLESCCLFGDVSLSKLSFVVRELTVVNRK